MITFGPVPSRRLGRSLGINNLPHKTCTYSCAYCQLGRTRHLRMIRGAWYDPQRIAKEVAVRLEKAARAGDSADVICFVPNGEPTLDRQLGREIDLLKRLGLKIAVITNASLIGRREVRDDLMRADWISLKIDTVNETVWRLINRPHGGIRLGEILDGMAAFARECDAVVTTETMLVKNLNDGDNDLEALRSFVSGLNPSTAYLAVPTRRPAEDWVLPTREYRLGRIYRRFADVIDHVELLNVYEGSEFTPTGDPRQELLRITSVHPMREDAVHRYLDKAGADWSLVERMITDHELMEADHAGVKYYTRQHDQY